MLWLFFNQHPLIHRQRSSRCPGISRLRRPAAGRSWTAIECSGWNKWEPTWRTERGSSGSSASSWTEAAGWTSYSDNAAPKRSDRSVNDPHDSWVWANLLPGRFELCCQTNHDIGESFFLSWDTEKCQLCISELGNTYINHHSFKVNL